MSTTSTTTHFITRVLLPQVATEHAFDLPPLQEDLSFLRLCHVLAYLCHAVYAHKQADVGSASTIEVPLAGALHDVTAVTATLIHFRCGRNAELEHQSSLAAEQPQKILHLFQITECTECEGAPYSNAVRLSRILVAWSKLHGLLLAEQHQIPTRTESESSLSMFSECQV